MGYIKHNCAIGALAALVLVACSNGESSNNPECLLSCQASSCGTMSDGCGGLLWCGNCPPDETCGGGGTPNVCGKSSCIPNTCATLGANCGTLSDSCGAWLDCGTCNGNGTCGGGGIPNVCGAGSCTPDTCATLGANCGTLSDSCGVWLDCGSCNGNATCGGGGTPNVCGVSCVGQCPLSYTCGDGVCQGGNAQQLLLDVKTISISGQVTQNSEKPRDSNDFCRETGPNPSPRGHVVLTDVNNPAAVFTLELQGCQPSTSATFSGVVFPGTYRVVVRGANSNLPKADFVVHSALTLSSNQSGMLLDVKTISILGRVTLSSENPKTSEGSCQNTTPPPPTRGRVVLTDVNNPAAVFTLDLEGCQTNAEATFSGVVFPGTYRIVVHGVNSDLPNSNFVAVPALRVP